MIKRVTAVVGLVLLPMLAAALGPVPAGASARGARRHGSPATRVSGQIYYDQRSCTGAKAHHAIPLVGAAVVLDRPGQALPVVTHLDSHGRYSAKLHGSGRPSVDVILQDRDNLVSVIPQGDNNNSFRVPLWQDAGRNPRFVLENADAAAANVFTVALRAAHYVRAHGIHVPLARFEIHEFLDTNDQDGAYYDKATRTIHLNNWRNDPSVDNAWEPFTIVHEYGHHVLFSVAPPPTNPGGTHQVDHVYPRIPGLAYSEGFAHALAALVLGTTKLGYDCKPLMNIGTVPATPLADVPAQAQFNETASGAAIWTLEKRFGLREFVYSLIGYKARAGHYPDDMRQVREAAVDLERGSATQHVSIDQVFGGQNLRWGVLSTLTHEPIEDGTANGTDMYYEIQLTLHGPYGDCQVNAKPGQYGADPSGDPRSPLTPPRPALTAYVGQQTDWDTVIAGDLPYTWQDECMLNTADGMIDPMTGPISEGTGSVSASGEVANEPSSEVLFPYLSQMAQHKQDFTLSARWVCVAPPFDDDPDPGDQEACGPGAFVFEYYNGLVKGLDDKVIPNTYGPAGPDNFLHIANVHSAVKIELAVNTDTPLIKWSTNGTCTVLVTGGTPCGTAEIDQ